MKKYKICPCCGTQNEPFLLECTACEADLLNVPAVSSETPQQSAPAPSAPAGNAFIRICDCGAENPPSARKCIRCGEDISDIMPVPASAPGRMFLVSEDGDFSYEIPDTPVIIGREQELHAYLCRKSYVSRKHIQLHKEQGRLFVSNLSRTNFTYLNNEKLDDAPHELKNGDLLSLGGILTENGIQPQAVYFRIRMEK